MAKVIRVEGDVVSIGMDDGGISDVRRCDCNFVPCVGDEVQIFHSGDRTIVSKTEKKSGASASEGINIQVMNNNTNTSPAYVVQGKVVNKVVYCVLALFLGGIGVHKFYAGKTGAGIAYLLFCWTLVPSFLACIDFIAALLKKSDGNGMIVM